MKKSLMTTVVSLIFAAVLTVSSISYTTAVSPDASNIGNDLSSDGLSRDYRTMMAHAASLIGLDRTETSSDSEEKGEGTVIAIIDSAFDTSHPIFALSEGAETKIKKDFVDSKVSSLSASKYYASKTDTGSLYLSDKIPFAYDYAERDNIVTSTDSHGTHVAAVAAGNSSNGGQFDGVAPDAQLILMKVFYDNGNFGGDMMLADAVNDAVALGADVINLSLGTSSGSSEYFGMPNLKYALEEAVSKGVIIVCASGNDGLAASGSTYDLDYAISKPVASNTDYGLVSEPSTLRQAISVGAAHNEVLYKKFVYSGTGDEILYSDPSSVYNGSSKNSFSSKFAGKTLNLVFVDGIGEEKDYEKLKEDGILVKGKVAVVSRGTITFVEKITNAYNAGAIGIIIYNNVPDDEMTMQTGDVEIPAISVSYEDGQKLLNLPADKRTVKVPDVPYVVVEDEEKSLLASFSSWGTTPELLIKPEITAIGNNVFSAINNSDYESMNGTSMSAPMITGASAIVKARLQKENPDLTGAELTAAVKSVLMNTAKVIEGEDGTAKSPRQQGSGLLDVSSAISQTTLLYYGDEKDITYESQPKIELGDGLLDTYTFPVTVYNTSDSEKEYSLSAAVQSDGYTSEMIGIKSKYFSDPDNPKAFVKSKITVDADSSNTNINKYSESSEYKFKVAAGEKKTVNITVSIDKSEFDEYNKIFTNGWFTEGFVYVTDTSDSSVVSIPFMGYEGIWDDVPMFDAISYDSNETIYPGQYVYADFGGRTYYYLGTNLFVNGTDFRSDLIAFSPNRDAIADAAYFNISPLRNICWYDIEVTNEKGEVVYTYYGDFIPKAYNYEGTVGYLIGLWDGTDGINARYILSDGKYTCTIIGYNYDGASQSISIPLVLDTKKPTVESTEIRIENGKTYLDIKASDTHYIQYAMAYLLKSGTVLPEGTPDGTADLDADSNTSKYLYMETYTPKYKKDSHSITYSFDITDVKEKYVYIEITDYAMNTTLVRVPIE